VNGIGAEFIEGTKYEYLEQSDQSKGLPQPPLEMEFDFRGNIINLPSPKQLPYGKMALIEAINNRRSLRRYANKALTSEELSYLLWCTQGVKKTKAGVGTLRTVPSAGARNAFETFLLVNHVENLDACLYRFLALEHKLAAVNSEKDIAEKIVAGCMGQGFAGLSAATFIWVADVPRMKWRYGERGYRYLHLDVGHVCQNLYLAAESIGCGACAIAAFDDDLMNEILGLDGKNRFVIYIAAIGKKQ
jgi:SagB-type dehydrogenase family enzyme